MPRLGQEVNSVLVKNEGDRIVAVLPPNAQGDVSAGASQGDAESVFTPSVGQWLDVRFGTAASPNSTPGPIIKVARTVSMLTAQISGDGSEQMASLHGICVGDANNQVQTVGTYGAAINQGTAAGASGSPDACGIYGIGQVKGSGIGTGIGAYLEGRRDTTTGKANGLEVRAANYTGTDGVYNTSGFSTVTGIWLSSNGSGTSKIGVGISFGNPFGHQWDVGIGFTSQGTGGSIATASIRDDSSAATSILIVSGHTTAAIAVTVAGGGTNAGVLIGGAASVTSKQAALEVIGTSTFMDPLVFIGSTSQAQSYKVIIRNSAGQHFLASCGSADAFLTGTAQGDLALVAASGSKSIHIGGTASVIKVTNGNALSFFAATGATKRTGWATWTGTAQRATKDTATATLVDVAQTLKALIDDFHAAAGYGLLNT